jgi:hypothetical protein
VTVSPDFSLRNSTAGAAENTFKLCRTNMQQDLSFLETIVELCELFSDRNGEGEGDGGGG